MATFTRYSSRAGGPAFPNAVVNVVQVRSKKQMIRTNARRIVALVANVHSRWDAPIGEHPRHAMRIDGLGRREADINPTIIPVASIAGPLPAAIVNTHSAEEFPQINHYSKDRYRASGQFGMNSTPFSRKYFSNAICTDVVICLPVRFRMSCKPSRYFIGSLSIKVSAASLASVAASGFGSFLLFAIVGSKVSVVTHYHSVGLYKPYSSRAWRYCTPLIGQYTIDNDKIFLRIRADSCILPLTPDNRSLSFPYQNNEPQRKAMRSVKTLIADRTATISDVRAAFAGLRLTKSESYDLSREMGYTPHGTRKDVLARLQSNIEGIKMSQARMGTILS